MVPAARIPLTPIPTAPGHIGFQNLLTWPFPAQPFYERQVIRVLQSDIPQRIAYGLCRVWTYWDPSANCVGFGTLDLCYLYAQFTGGKVHGYIPLLAVHPGFQKRGHGLSIVEHLVGEAVSIHGVLTHTSDLLFLDVYAANQGAISLYRNKCGFVTLNPNNPIPDPEENNEPYLVMGRKI